MYLSIVIDIILAILPLLGGAYIMLIGYKNKKEYEELALYGVGILLLAAGIKLLSFSADDSLVTKVTMSALIILAFISFTMSAVKWGMPRKAALWLQVRIKSAKSRRRQPRLVKAKKRK